MASIKDQILALCKEENISNWNGHFISGRYCDEDYLKSAVSHALIFLVDDQRTM